MLAWLRIAADCQGVSSHTERTSIDKNGVVVFVEDASACKTAVLMPSGLYSGFAMHDPVHLYLWALCRAPKIESSRNAKQYVIQGSIGQMSGLANISGVVWKVVSIAFWSSGGGGQWLVVVYLLSPLGADEFCSRVVPRH